MKIHDAETHVLDTPPGVATVPASDNPSGSASADGGSLTRRLFLQTASAALATRAIPVHAQVPREEAAIRIGLIGCGGRGTGALLDALGAASRSVYPAEGYHTEDVAEGAAVEQENVEVVALADLFSDRLERCRRNLSQLQIDLGDEHCFTGFDAYARLLELPEINYVILATPPHFRPAHLMAAIQAGKNAFMEKPAAVDGPGVRLVLEAGRLAAEKGLSIGAGTQRRHTPSYRETVARIQDGALGELQYAKCYWNGGQIWVVNREPGWSDMEWQLRNWNYFTWLSGDHIVEQHVHNLDVMNWVLGGHPLRAVSGLGGRQVRVGERHGHIFDHFAVEYEYPGGISMFSQCRQINGCQNTVGESVVGSLGRSNCQDRIDLRDGTSWRYDRRDRSGYQLEHENVIRGILGGAPLNEASSLAESTLTAIMGREAVYSGREITWEQALQSTLRLGPEVYEFGPGAMPPVAMPGSYRFS